MHKTTREILNEVFGYDDIMANQSLFDRAEQNNDLEKKWAELPVLPFPMGVKSKCCEKDVYLTGDGHECSVCGRGQELEAVLSEDGYK